MTYHLEFQLGPIAREKNTYEEKSEKFVLDHKYRSCYLTTNRIILLIG